jgi:sugar (pentulose or hexulose) kinase
MFLGIELGSTRIKGVIIDLDNQTIASSSYRWQSSFEHGYWTYNLDEVWLGIKQVILDLNTQVPLKSLKAMGVSAMMHGLLAFDEVGKLLTPFRTWKNTNTEKAASELSHLFNFNIPLRWSIAHLYQTILDQEPFLKRVHHINTLAGYVHECLTGQFVIGIGDASGMFPVDLKTKDYDEKML